MASTSEDQTNREETPKVKETIHKTKLIKFFGRNVRIILQNENGPCPLIAICNVLLLRDKLGLSLDVIEVSQEKLLTLVAERLIDSISDDNNKDAGNVENRHQTIADAIDLLPRFATGIDVNIKFNRIDDFELTKECAVFGLLDIPLYHGWLVDPQDSDASNAIGSMSYNTVMEELVALETRTMDALKLKETVNPTSANDDWVTFETDPEKDVCSFSDADKTSHDGQINTSESGKRESKDGTEKTSTEVVKKAENSDGDNSGSRIRYNDDWVTFGTNPGEDVCSSLDVGKASHDEQMNTSESEKHESCSSAPNVVPESSKDMTDGITARQGELNTSESEKHESCSSAPDVVPESSKDMTDGITARQGELITNFLMTNGTQLSPYGLSCLQSSLKEHELCVFFRNNHFNTMFKFGGALYTLVTDQGFRTLYAYVWEKLNEVNGNTVYANSKFQSFRASTKEIEEIGSSDEEKENADLASVFEYLAKPDKRTAQRKTSFDFDLEQEFEEPQSEHVPSSTFPSGFIVGPSQSYSPWPRNRSLSYRRQSKRVREKCTLM